MSDKINIKLINQDGSKTSLYTIKGKSIWESLLLHGKEIPGTCGGKGICGKCKIRIDGITEEISEQERNFLLADEIKMGQRIACLCKANDAVNVYIDDILIDSKSKETIIRTNYNIEKINIQKKKFFILGKDKDHPVPIFDRLKEALNTYELRISAENIIELAQIDRFARPVIELSAIVQNNKNIIHISPKEEEIYGLAIDIGSTSIFIALINLETAQVLNVISKTNLQKVYGEDIISRISYFVENENNENLHRVLINSLNSMISDLVKEKNININNIYRAIVVGNPVMLHFFFGLSVEGFASMPFSGMFTEEFSISGGQSQLEINPAGEIIALPQVAGFVGADTIACLLSLADPNPKESFLLLDIGTNGEVVLYHNKKYYAASAAAGPAFEGGALQHGMRALPGAIDHVEFIDDSLKFNVIAHEKPKGICGSGLIDLIASMLKAGCIDKFGNLQDETILKNDIRQGKNAKEIVLFDKDEALLANDLVFTQEDIRQFQLAKSAIRSAIEIIMKVAGIDFSELHKVYLAGAFGHYIDANNAIITGLIPPKALSSIKNIGNAAATGAILALLDDKQRIMAKTIKDKTEYIELATHQDFQDIFIKNMNF